MRQIFDIFAQSPRSLWGHKLIRESLGLAHSFKPTDERAVFIFDAAKQLSQFNIIS